MPAVSRSFSRKRNVISAGWIASWAFIAFVSLLPSLTLQSQATERPYAREVNLVRAHRRALINAAAPFYLAQHELDASLKQINARLNALHAGASTTLGQVSTTDEETLERLSGHIVALQDFKHALSRDQVELRAPFLKMASAAQALDQIRGGDIDQTGAPRWSVTVQRLESEAQSRMTEWERAATDRLAAMRAKREGLIQRAVDEVSRKTLDRIQLVAEESAFSLRLGELRGTFMLLDHGIGRALSKGDVTRAVELFQGRLWLQSRLELLPALLKIKGTLSLRSIEQWRRLMDWVAATTNDWREEELGKLLSYSTSQLKLRTFARVEGFPEEGEIPEVPADEETQQEGAADGADGSSDSTLEGPDSVGNSPIEFDRTGREQGDPQTVEKFQELDPDSITDPGLRLELHLPARSGVPAPHDKVSGIALMESSGKKARDIAPVSKPEQVEKAIAQDINSVGLTSFEPGADSKDTSETAPLRHQIERADRITSEGLKTPKSEEDRAGLKRLKAETRATLAAHDWIEKAVKEPLKKTSKILHELLDTVRKPLGLVNDSRAPSPAAADDTAERRMAVEAALGLAAPGYDIANFIVAMATGETIVGDTVEGGMGWSLLAAAAVLTVVEPFGSKAPVLKALEKAVKKGTLSDEAARGLIRLAEAGHEHFIEPLLKHSEEAAEKIGKILAGAEKFEVKSAARVNDEFVKEAMARGREAIPPHHVDLPLIEITGAPKGAEGFMAHSAAKEPYEGHWISLIDPRAGTKASYKEEMSILDRFGNRMDQVSRVDLSRENFTLSFAAPVKDAANGEFHAGGGLQGMFKDGQKPPPKKWTDPYDWIEGGAGE